MVLEAGSLRSRWWQGRFLVRPLSLACRWPHSCCTLTRPFLCVLASLVSPPLLRRVPVISLGPHPYDLTFTTSLKALPLNTVTLGVKLHHLYFWGKQFSPWQDRASTATQRAVLSVGYRAAAGCTASLCREEEGHIPGLQSYHMHFLTIHSWSSGNSLHSLAPLPCHWELRICRVWEVDSFLTLVPKVIKMKPKLIEIDKAGHCIGKTLKSMAKDQVAEVYNLLIE